MSEFVEQRKLIGFDLEEWADLQAYRLTPWFDLFRCGWAGQVQPTQENAKALIISLARRCIGSFDCDGETSRITSGFLMVEVGRDEIDRCSLSLFLCLGECALEEPSDKPREQEGVK